MYMNHIRDCPRAKYYTSLKSSCLKEKTNGMKSRSKYIVATLVVLGLSVFFFVPVIYIGTVSGGPPPPNGPVKFAVFASISCKLFGIGVIYWGGSLDFGCSLPILI